MEHQISKSSTPSHYYIVTRQRKISIWTKLLRFIVRYIGPILILTIGIICVDMILFKDTSFTSVDKIKFILTILVTSILAIVLSNLWFKLITKIEDKE